MRLFVPAVLIELDFTQLHQQQSTHSLIFQPNSITLKEDKNYVAVSLFPALQNYG